MREGGLVTRREEGGRKGELLLSSIQPRSNILPCPCPWPALLCSALLCVSSEEDDDKEDDDDEEDDYKDEDNDDDNDAL